MYDDAGLLIRTTVTREPEWDEQQRLLMLALSQVESESCPGCGFHSSVVVPENFFTPHVRKCSVCAGADVFARVQREADDKAEKRLGKDPEPKKARPSDGRHTSMRAMSPDEVAKHKASKETKTNPGGR